MGANYSVEKKPPTYRISPMKILLILAFFIISFLVAFVLSRIFEDYGYLSGCFLFIFEILCDRFCCYFIGGLEDLSSEIFHPNLMSKKEYVSLKKRYERLSWKKSNYKEDGKPFPEKYQTLFDDLESIYEYQADLRLQCWFTIMFGVPVVDKNNGEELIPSGTNLNVQEESTKTDQSNSNDNSESGTLSTENDESDSDDDSGDDAESDAASTGDNSDSEFYSDSDSESYSVSTDDESDFEFDSDVSVISENDSNIDDIKMMKSNDENFHDQNEIDKLKIQFTEIKAENSKLKNIIETFITSQTCV